MNALETGVADDAWDALESAEDFLEYFELDYDPGVLRVARLHILQRFHDYLRGVDWRDRAACRAALERAYGDFVRSSPMQEKVFRVLRQAAGIATVPVSAIGRVRR